MARRRQKADAAAGGVLQKAGPGRHQQGLQPEVVGQMFAQLNKGLVRHDRRLFHKPAAAASMHPARIGFRHTEKNHKMAVFRLARTPSFAIIYAYNERMVSADGL